MKKYVRISAAFLIFAVVGTAADLKALYDAHQWFELRQALDPSAPPLYRGAVAAAFNNVADAETLLNSVMDKGSDADAADAGKWLSYLYLRIGQYQKAADQVDWVRMLPNQSVDQFAPSTVAVRARRRIFIPASIAGHTVEFFLDSDANFSFLSESAAHSLGLTVRDSGLEVHGVTGKQTGFRVAVADTVTIGGITLRNVPFLVLADTEQAFQSFQTSDQGAFGISVLFALRSLHFHEGSVDIGAAQPANNQPNLCFDGLDPVVEVEFRGERLPFIFDTGAEVSELWPPFAKRFPDLASAGASGSKLEIGIGGKSRVPERILPDVPLSIGGFEVHLHSGHLLLAQTVPDSQYYYGRLGWDALSQSHDLSIEFNSLIVRSEQ